MPSVFVTLVGGSPWGFRIQGGRGTGLPLRLSKVNPGSKAYHQGLLEGDFLKMVNGYVTDGLSQMDVQNIIKETGTHLTLEVERNPVQSDIEKTYTARTTITLNGSPNYKPLFRLTFPICISTKQTDGKGVANNEKEKKSKESRACLRLFSWLLLLSLPQKNHVLPDPEIPHLASRTKIWEDGERKGR
ncbi:PDZ domain-containing protein [Nephila pilipes]|uniref:PDZ domain-containing protein n=1 Tax=Nephila pilipes TaxID=299642 RepID=A0A8X6PV16_NEPPI|nr:PDZ domain-containing protein [Nephila pilipes]